MRPNPRIRKTPHPSFAYRLGSFLGSIASILGSILTVILGSILAAGILGVAFAREIFFLILTCVLLGGVVYWIAS